MSTANNVELLIITVVVSALFVALIALLIEVMVVVSKIKHLVDKAGELVKDVESAAEAVGHMARSSASRFPLISFIHELFNSTKHKK